MADGLKRLATSTVFLVAGLITTWFSCWVGSRIPLRFDFRVTLRGLNGCYEIDACTLPWWAAGLLLGYLFGPSLVFAIVGWRVSRDKKKVHSMVFRLTTLVSLTACFYLMSYAAGP